MSTLRVVFAALLMAVSHTTCHAEDGRTAQTAWRVFFSPHGGATEEIVAELNAARESVFIQAYTFTSLPIAKAILAANSRGVRIEVLLDKINRSAKYSAADFLAHQGIPVKIDAAHAIAHNKVIVIDGVTVITGSFNFTKAAETSNAENLLVVRDKELATSYAVNWASHARHSENYVGR